MLIFDKQISKYKHKTILPKFNKVSSLIVKHYKKFVVAFVVILIPGYFGYTHAKQYYNLTDTLPDSFDSIISGICSASLLPSPTSTQVPAIILPEDRNYRKAPRMATYVNIRICLNQAFYEYNIYIGQNDTSDFNVRRNTAYTYNVTILGTNPDDYRIAKTEYTFWGTKAGDKEYLNTLDDE